MNITPEQAQEWLDGATPGPRTASEGTGFIAAAEGERAVLTAERGDWWCEEDHRLAAAAPDLAQTVIDQAEKIRHLQDALRKADKWGDCLNMLWDDGFLVEGDMD